MLYKVITSHLLKRFDKLNKLNFNLSKKKYSVNKTNKVSIF